MNAKTLIVRVRNFSLSPPIVPYLVLIRLQLKTLDLESLWMTCSLIQRSMNLTHTRVLHQKIVCTASLPYSWTAPSPIETARIVCALLIEHKLKPYK